MSKNTSWSNRQHSKEFSRNRIRVRQRDMGCCIRCLTLEGRIVPGMDVDHFIPVSKGGGDDLYSLWLLCKDCHSEKTARESNGLSGFKTRFGLDGWPLADNDWLEIIKERQKEYER